MKLKKTVSILSAALAVCALWAPAFAETITMADAGYGVNGGKSFFPDGITAYSSTLGDLSDECDSIDFTISAADLGGRDDLCFQVYVAAGDWSLWANGGETPAISEAGTEYSFSLNVDEIADANGRDLVICDIGFQILSATPGDVDVTYTVSYSENGSAANKPAETVAAPAAPADDTEKPANDKGSPDTGAEDVAVFAGIAIVSASAILISRKRK